MTLEARRLGGWLLAPAGEKPSGRQSEVSHHRDKSTGSSLYGTQGPGLGMAGKEKDGKRTSVQNQQENRPGLREAGAGAQKEQAQGQQDQHLPGHQCVRVEEASPPSR